ncbi:MAG: hypothetical protein J7L69_05990 [Desulfobulbaceae bacterium]|nr:hypothetical protein [Desulfobulbaceae bacterium]
MNEKAPAICLLIFLFLCFHVPSAFAEIKTGGAESVEVKIVSLRDGEKVHGKVSIEAIVSQPEQIKFIDFYIQEPGAKDRYGWQDCSAPYFWGGDVLMLDTTLFDDGPASAAAFGRLKDRNMPQPGDRVNFIIDNGKPVVKILAPEDQVDITEDTFIQVNAVDQRGLETVAGVSSVSIYLDGGLLCKLTKKPFKVLLETCLLSPGLHSIRAVVEDLEGMNGTDNIMVTVNHEATSLMSK